MCHLRQFPEGLSLSKVKRGLDVDILKELKDIMEEKGITEYKLSKLSNVPQSTINSMFNKYNNPSIYTLECLCKGLGITLSQFFYQEQDKADIMQDTNFILLSQEWDKLNQEQKKALLNLLQSFNQSN